MPSYFKCAFTHVVFGVSLFVLGIISLRLNKSGFWTGLVIVSGVWMCITGGILVRNWKRISCTQASRPKALAGALFASSLCGLAVGACYIELVLVLSFCEYSSCEPERTVAAIVLVLGFVQCFTGCGGCCWFSWYSSQADQISSPPNVAGGDAQMVPTCMPPRSVFEDNDRPPPYVAGSQGPDLLLVPLEMTPTCMPPRETGPPPPYHQISTTGAAMSSFHDGHQPPPYVRTDEQHPVMMTYV